MERDTIRILITEDNPADVRLVCELLKESGRIIFTTEVAACLVEALQKLGRETFDILLLDLGLPDSRGLETLERIVREFSKIPIIVLTGNIEEELGIKAIQKHASDYLVKGKIDENILIRSIRYAIERKRIEQELEEVAEKYSTLFNTISDGVWINDLSGEMLEVNDAYCRMSGYSHEEFIHMPISKLEAIESPQEISDHIKKVIEMGGHDRFESRHRRKDGSVFDVDITALYLEREGGRIAIFVRDITRRKQMERALKEAKGELEERVKERTQRLKNANTILALEIEERKQVEKLLTESERELQNLSYRLITAQEAERKRVALELHDEISSKLAAIKFGLEKRLIQAPETIDQERKPLEYVIDTVKETMTSIRRIMVNLRPSMIDDLGLLPTITWHCRELRNVYDTVTIEKEFDIDEEDIPGHLKIVIFRIIQEAMHNVYKHSQADQVRLSLKRIKGVIELLVEDNGQGFHVVGGNRVLGGFGLTSIKERIRHSGGTFSIESLRGKGTVIRVTWPYAI